MVRKLRKWNLSKNKRTGGQSAVFEEFNIYVKLKFLVHIYKKHLALRRKIKFSIHKQ